MLGTSINDSFVAALHVYGTKMWNLRIRNYSKVLTNMEDHYISSEKTLYTEGYNMSLNAYKSSFQTLHSHFINCNLKPLQKPKKMPFIFIIVMDMEKK